MTNKELTEKCKDKDVDILKIRKEIDRRNKKD